MLGNITREKVIYIYVKMLGNITGERVMYIYLTFHYSLSLYIL